MSGQMRKVRMQLLTETLDKLPNGIVHVGDQSIAGILHGPENYTSWNQDAVLYRLFHGPSGEAGSATVARLVYWLSTWCANTCWKPGSERRLSKCGVTRIQTMLASF